MARILPRRGTKKAAQSATGKPPVEKKPGRIKQIRESYKMTKQGDPNIGWILLGTFLVAALVVFGICAVLHVLAFGIIIGLMFGLLAMMFVFARRAQASAMAQIKGKPGAAAAALSMLRRGWHTDPTVAFTKQQDVVTRLVGPPGIVLIGEGNVNRLRPLLTSERRKHERVVSETPVHELVIGDEQGQVPLTKVVKYVRKLPKGLKPAEMTDVLARLKALDANRSNIPMPKGPVPTSMKGSRQNLRGR